MIYKIISSKKIEKTLNEMAKENWTFVCFVPTFVQGLLYKPEMIFKK